MDDCCRSGNASAASDLLKEGKTLNKRKAWRKIGDFLIRLAGFLFAVWILFGVIFGVTSARSTEMEPAVCAGDLILYDRLEKKLLSGDVVLYQCGDREALARIRAKSGDTVEVTEDGALRINGGLVSNGDVYAAADSSEAFASDGVSVKDDQYFVTCDRGTGEYGVRPYRMIQKEDIKGKVRLFRHHCG